VTKRGDITGFGDALARRKETWTPTWKGLASRAEIFGRRAVVTEPPTD